MKNAASNTTSTSNEYTPTGASTQLASVACAAVLTLAMLLGVNTLADTESHAAHMATAVQPAASTAQS